MKGNAQSLKLKTRARCCPPHFRLRSKICSHELSHSDSGGHSAERKGDSISASNPPSLRASSSPLQSFTLCLLPHCFCSGQVPFSISLLSAINLPLSFPSLIPPNTRILPAATLLAWLWHCSRFCCCSCFPLIQGQRKPSSGYQKAPVISASKAFSSWLFKHSKVTTQQSHPFRFNKQLRGEREFLLKRLIRRGVGTTAKLAIASGVWDEKATRRNNEEVASTSAQPLDNHTQAGDPETAQSSLSWEIHPF